MKRIIAALALFLAVNGFAVIEVGQAVPQDSCWETLGNGTVCLSDVGSAVVTLVYNAGWCPACNDEVEQLSRRYSEMQGKAAIFISLSEDGANHGDGVNQAFLQQWKDQHQIPFIVAAAPHDPGKLFFDSPYYIPAVVIIDGSGNLAYKNNSGTSVDEIFAKVNSLLSRKPSLH